MNFYDGTEREYLMHIKSRLLEHLKQETVDIVDEDGTINFNAIECELELFIDEWINL